MDAIAGGAQLVTIPPKMKPETIIQIIISLAGMFIGPWLAVRWSLRQFRSQKWWEKQHETYGMLLEHLSIIQYNSAEHCYAMELEGHQYTPSESMSPKVHLARNELEKYVAQGAYLISDEAAEALRTYQVESWDEPNNTEHETYKKSYDAAKKCIVVLTAEAKKLLL